MKSPPFKPTDPTVIDGLPVSFLLQPARLSSEPSNSGFPRTAASNHGICPRRHPPEAAKSGEFAGVRASLAP